MQPNRDAPPITRTWFIPAQVNTFPMAAPTPASTIVTDDLSARKPAVERLGVDHQICIAHAKKRVWNRFDRIDGWDWGKARVRRLLTELPPECDSEIPRLKRAWN